MAKKKLANKLCSAFLSFLHGKPLLRANPSSHTSHPILPKSPSMDKLSNQTLVVDVEEGLLRSSSSSSSSCSSLFSYFMLVALEAGGFLRGFLLLLLYPLVCCVGNELGLKIMVMATFCGLRERGVARVGRAVLPKWFLEDVGLEGFEVMRKALRKVCVSRLPRVMVEGFLREYLEVEVVVGRELKVVCGFYTGIMEEDHHHGMVLEGLFKAEEQVGTDVDVVGFSSSIEFFRLPLSSSCKEIYMVSKEEKNKWRPLPREKYPKPLVFHDGRLAFLPTPTNTVAMFVWLPVGIPLGITRLAISLSLPYKYSTPILAMTGMKWKLKGRKPPSFSQPNQRGQLFVCNHRTLIDPIYVAVAIDNPVHAVCYSVSRFSEIISPVRTVRLTRSRDQDGKMMASLLDKGEPVVICPEGTTCREPYLLRFSPLFAELSDDVIPVALNVTTSMFYATTASGFKCFDSLFYMINPSMCYEVQFLDKVDTSSVKNRKASSIDMANHVQKEIGTALGFSCTMLTRKDKYLMLAGNDGSVKKKD